MKQRNLLAILSAGLILAVGCTDPVGDFTNTIHTGEDNANVETKIFSTFDVMDDIASTDGRLNKTGSTILPSGAIVTFTDSLFDDGDGVEFTIDFGELGTENPKGMFCQDDRFRAGKLHISLSDRYSEIGAKLTVDIKEEDQFFVGNGFDMYQVIGLLIAERTNEKTVVLTIMDASITLDDQVLTYACERTIEMIKDSGPGIWLDEYSVTGSANGTNRHGKDYTVEIDEPLIKRIETGCAKTFIDGNISIQQEGSDDKILVDFDPDNDQACDTKVRIEFNGIVQEVNLD